MNAGAETGRWPVPTDAPGYVAALEQMLGAHWAGLAHRVMPDATDARVIARGDLDRAQTLADCLDRFARAHPDTDLKALASLWTQWYAATTWPALAAGAVLLGVGPRLDEDEAGIVLDDDARPVGVRIGGVAVVETAEFLETLARRQAQPVMAAAAATGLSPRVPWSNAINVLGWMLDQLRAFADERRLESAFGVLARPYWSDGTPNPLAAGGDCATGRPARRVCCLRYRLQDFDYCGDCPIPESNRR